MIEKLIKMNSKEMIDSIMLNNNDTKLSIAIIKDGEIDYKIYGKNSELESTIYDYEIGSISKTFVALLLSKAIYENKICLTDSINKYLSLNNNYYPTLERLITHTSGYNGFYFDKQMIKNLFKEPNDFYGIKKEHILNNIKKHKLINKDYKFSYSNFGTSVVGLVLENVYKKDFVSLMNDFIKEQLKLENTKVAYSKGNLKGYWNWQQNDAYIPAGAIISDIKNMAKYLDICINSNDTYITNTYVPIKNIDDIDDINKTYSKLNIIMDKVGMAWMLDTKNNIIWHNGATSKYNTYLGFNKNKKIGVVVLCNLPPRKKIPMTIIGVKIMMELLKESKD